MMFKLKNFLPKINSSLNTEHVKCMILRLTIYSMPSTKQWDLFILQPGPGVISRCTKTDKSKLNFHRQPT